MLIKNHEKGGLKRLKDPKVFIGYSDNMQNVPKNIEKYNSERQHQALIALDDMIAV